MGDEICPPPQAKLVSEGGRASSGGPRLHARDNANYPRYGGTRAVVGAAVPAGTAVVAPTVDASTPTWRIRRSSRLREQRVPLLGWSG